MRQQRQHAYMIHKATAQKLESQKKYLEAYSRLGHQGSACTAAGISYGTVQVWKKDEVFSVSLSEAKELFDGALQSEVLTRGVFGYEEPLIHKGQIQYLRDPTTGELELDDELKPIVATVTKKSDRLLAIAARANVETYKPNTTVEVTGPDGKPLQNHIQVEFVAAAVTSAAVAKDQE